ncbi:MAG: FAD-dependent monooxygenase [Candidatus Heimdallarchaeota archaeon]|nr:FAD-dependent monooxygenase [Candidatus Heimdallarchaeota archaeon]
MSLSKKVTVVGAGLVGSLAALSIAKKGFQVNLYEKLSDIRKQQQGAGRSINLALSHRGIKALTEAGIIDDVMKLAIPMRGRRIHAVDGSLTFQPYGKDDSESINSVSRAELNKLLITKAEELENVNVHFDHECLEMDYRSNILKFKNTVDNSLLEIDPGILIGSDGGGSTVRRSMLMADLYNYSQDFLEYGYKELEIPAGDNNSYLIEKNALHIWPRKSYMLIALPNLDGSFTVTLFLQMKKNNYSFENLKTEDEIMYFFNEQFPDVVSLMPNLVVDFANATGFLGTIKIHPWHFKDKSTLIGDAAHAIVPFYGQGMNAGFEDVSVLIDLISNHHNWGTIFEKFSEKRKQNTDAIANLSLENFVTMRDSVADEHFLMRKEAEIKLYQKYPQDIVSKYSMVTFHPEIPYSKAKQKGEILEDVLTTMSKEIDNIDQLDLYDAYLRIVDNYSKLSD